MTDAVVPYTGWGRGGWSSLSFGTGSTTPTVALNASVGSVTIFSVENATVNLTGLQGTANFGGIMVEPDMNVFPGGVFATASVSGVSDVVGEAVIDVIGEEAASGFDPVTLNIVVDVPVTGVQAIGQLSGVMVEPDMNDFPVGISAVTEISGVEVSTSALVSVTGLSATAPHSNVTVEISVAPLIVGLEAPMTTAGVLVWGRIDPDQVPGFVGIAPDQSAAWTQEAPSQAPGFVGIAPGQAPNWTEIVPEAA